jgi:hypothetical protein
VEIDEILTVNIDFLNLPTDWSELRLSKII